MQGFFLSNIGAEQDRWPLWLPVALGVGAGGYFALSFEPSLAAGWIALVLALAAALLALLGHLRWMFALTATAGTLPMRWACPD
jgi:competence protein ComEC